MSLFSPRFLSEVLTWNTRGWNLGPLMQRGWGQGLSAVHRAGCSRRPPLIPRNHPWSQASLLNCITTSWCQNTHSLAVMPRNLSPTAAARSWQWQRPGPPRMFFHIAVFFKTAIINGFVVFYQVDASIIMLIQSSNVGYLVTCKFLL